MSDPIVAKIEAYFAAHQAGGEFVRLPCEAPYQWIGAAAETTMLLYITKQSQLTDAFLDHVPQNVSLIGRKGLPSVGDRSLIEGISRGAPIGFLGDLDPVDLLIFAWLQAQCSNTTVRLLGIGDSLWGELGPAEQARIAMPQHASEVVALSLLYEALPNLPQQIGPKSHKLLQAGQKVELEGLIHFHPWSPARFWELVVGSRSA